MSTTVFDAPNGRYVRRSAVIFAVVFSVISTRIQEKIQSDNLAEQHKALSDQLLKTIVAQNLTYMPISIFRESSSFNHELNQAISKSLEAATLYFFRGASARFIPIRLQCAGHLPQQVKILMLDVKSDKMVRRGAFDRSLY